MEGEQSKREGTCEPPPCSERVDIREIYKNADPDMNNPGFVHRLKLELGGLVDLEAGITSDFHGVLNYSGIINGSGARMGFSIVRGYSSSCFIFGKSIDSSHMPDIDLVRKKLKEYGFKLR